MGSRLRRLLAWPWHVFNWLMIARPIRFTRFGMLYILFVLAIGASAINSGNNLLYLILGILLGFIVVSGFLSDSCLWGLRSEWILPGSLYAGTTVSGECRLQKGWFPAVLVKVTARWIGAAPTSHLIYWLGSRRQELVRFQLEPDRRGWLALESVEVSTLFPFGLFIKFHRYPRDERWLVYPKLIAVPDRTPRVGDNGLLDGAASRSGAGEVPYLLRDYRAGDSARLIHWKTSARRQRYMVKEMEEHTAPARWLAIPRWPPTLSRSEQEDLLSFSASLAKRLFQEGRSIGLWTPDFLVDPRTTARPLHQIYRALALFKWPRAEAHAIHKATPADSINVLAQWQERYG